MLPISIHVVPPSGEVWMYVFNVLIPNTDDVWNTVIASVSCGKMNVAASVTAEAIDERNVNAGELGILIAMIVFTYANKTDPEKVGYASDIIPPQENVGRITNSPRCGGNCK
jgi:hypothetical protein